MKLSLIAKYVLPILILTILSTGVVMAGLDDWGGNNLNNAASATAVYETYGGGNTTATIARYIGSILNVAPFLGIIFLIMVLYSGYQWMTAGGNVETVALAKKRIINATIGILLFAVLYVLAYFFVANFAEVGGYKI